MLNAPAWSAFGADVTPGGDGQGREEFSSTWAEAFVSRRRSWRRCGTSVRGQRCEAAAQSIKI